MSSPRRQGFLCAWFTAKSSRTVLVMCECSVFGGFCLFKYLFIYLFSCMPKLHCGMRDLSSPTRNWTHALCVGRWDHQGNVPLPFPCPPRPPQVVACELLVAEILLCHVGSCSLTRNGIRAPALGVQSLSHWTIREAPLSLCCMSEWFLQKGLKDAHR